MSYSQISPGRSWGLTSNGEGQYHIAGMALGDDLRIGSFPRLLSALVTNQKLLEARILALEIQRPTPDIVTPTNPSLPGRSTKAGTAPQSSTCVQTLHGQKVNLSATDLAIDNLDNDVLFASPSAHRADYVTDVPAIDTVNPVNINDVDETNADDSMETFFNFSAASISDNAGMSTAINGFDINDGTEDMADFPAASTLHNSVIPNASGLAMTAHVSPGNSILADYTLCTAVASSPSAPAAVQVAAPSLRRHQCITCHKSFARRADRNRHSLTHNTNSLRTYSCPSAGCPRVGNNGFWRSDKLNEHRAHMRH